jgi:hypothetical protein
MWQTPPAGHAQPDPEMPRCLKNVSGELPVRARSVMQQGVELVLGNSREQALRPGERLERGAH